MQNNTFLLRIILIVFGIISPLFFVQAEILITEVAWMGTSTSQYEEWIELYNNGTDDIPLTGWKLFKTGGVVLFSPTGTIPAGTYYLICRATASLTDPLAGICNEKGTFGGSGLNNTNDQLVLKDSSGAVKESLDASGGWPAGDAASKQTMQKLNADWITATGTPGTETITSPDSDPQPHTNAAPSDDPDPQPPKTEPASKGVKVEQVKPDPKYEALVVIPDFGTAGVTIPMSAQVRLDKKLKVLQGRYEWSTGDGGSYKFLKNIPINHIYYYPGTYTVVMQYYSNIFREEPDTIHRKTITIVPSDIEILEYSEDGGLQLKNNASKDIAVDGWIIQSNTQEFIFPKYTTIPKGATLSLSSKVLGIPLSKNSVLLNPSRKIISKYSYKYKPAETITDEVFVDEPDPQPISISQPLPKPKTVRDFWHQNKWYVIFGGIVLVSILAYLAFHLYAKQDELI